MNNNMITVTGANGFVGRRLVEILIKRGFLVRSVTRKKWANGPSEQENIAIGSMEMVDDWARIVGESDTVVHTAGRAHILREDSNNPKQAFLSANLNPTIALADMMKGTGKHLIFLSSVGVHGSETFADPFCYSDKPRPHSHYAASKHKAELYLTDMAKHHKLKVTIIRPPLVLGKGAKGNFGMLERAVLKSIPLPLGRFDNNKRDFVSRDTLVDLICHCTEVGWRTSNPLLVSDSMALSTKDLILEIARLHNVEPRLLPIPKSLIEIILKMVGRAEVYRQLAGNLEVDISLTEEWLNWKAPRKTIF